MSSKETFVALVVALLVACVIGGIVLACYENAKSNREVKQQKFNSCLQAGGTPIINGGGNNVMCIYGKSNANG